MVDKIAQSIFFLFRFVCQLISDPSSSRYATFSIIETNSFKHINHLSLQFNPGNDSSIKQYLASLVKELKSENEKLKDHAKLTESQFTKTVSEDSQKIETLMKQLEIAKREAAEATSNLKLANATEIAREKDRAALEKDSIRNQYEHSQKLLQQKFEDQICSLNKELAQVTSQNQTSTQRSQQLHVSLDTCNKELERVNLELATSKVTIERLTTEIRESNTEQAEQRAKVSLLKKDLGDVQASLRNSEDMARDLQTRLNAALEHKVSTNEALDVYKQQHSNMEANFKNANQEIVKGNEIIRKLQQDLKTAKSKLKLKNVVTLQQEKLLDERTASQEAGAKEIENLKEAILRKTEQVDSLSKKIEQLNTSLEEGKAIIQDNNHGRFI